MRTPIIASAAALLAAAAPPPAWRPEPVRNATEPSEIVKAAPAAAWRDVAPDALLIMELKDGGRIAIELAPDFAPVHVANIRALARAGWWTGASVYRVQENYVVQWGVNESPAPLPAGVVKVPPAEYDRALAGLAFRPLPYPDSYAPVAGHAGGWPVAADPKEGRAWLAHCYGMIGVGRDMAPDTGTGGELYAVIGHAPRALDRNIAVVGRVIEGIERLSGLPRGTEALGIYKDRAQDVPITSIRLASEMPAAERPQFEYMDEHSPAFAAYLRSKANRKDDFYIRSAGGVDLCGATVPVRRKPAS